MGVELENHEAEDEGERGDLEKDIKNARPEDPGGHGWFINPGRC